MIIKEVKVKREKAKYKKVIVILRIILMQKQNREVTNIELERFICILFIINIYI